MSDICSSCGNYKNLPDAREDHIESFLNWLDREDLCIRRLGDEEVLDNEEVLQQHVDDLRLAEEERDEDDEWVDLAILEDLK